MWREEEFQGIILTEAEKRGIKLLQENKKMQMQDIPGFDGLKRAGFVKRAEKPELDEYGGLKDGTPYKLSEKWTAYQKYYRSNQVGNVFRWLWNIVLRFFEMIIGG